MPPRSLFILFKLFGLLATPSSAPLLLANYGVFDPRAPRICNYNLAQKLGTYFTIKNSDGGGGGSTLGES